MSLRRTSAAVLIVLNLTLSSCARMACEVEWHLTMAPKMEPLREVDRVTDRERRAGRAAFKRDFIEMCAAF